MDRGTNALQRFVAEQRQLLDLERQAEIAAAEQSLHTRSDAELVARGDTLLRLEVVDLEPGFGGRVHAVLRPSREPSFPAHRLGPGDLIAVRGSRDEAPITTAVVVRVRAEQLTIALDDEDAELPPLVRLDRVASDVTYRRLHQALGGLLADRKGAEAKLLQVLFGEREPERDDRATIADHAWFDPGLDASQRNAVDNALRAAHVALIHGPPGTGKTTAVVELIRQAVARGERVLACAPSNIAVDNLAERLARAGVRIVRLGHPARVMEAVVEHSLAAQVDRAPEQKLLRDVRRELDTSLRQLHRAKSRADRFAARDQVRQLRREQRQLEQAVTRGIVDGAEVVLATLVGAADGLLAETRFDRLVVDEAAQALEAACWIPLQRADRVVLAGDHCQLPPTIHSSEASRRGLARTLFERLAEAPNAAATTRMLTVQYRMHEAIMAFSAERFYAGRLQADASVREHLLTDLRAVNTTEWTSQPLCFVDTAGTGFEETHGDDEGSKANPGEAELVAKIVDDLLAAGVAPGEVAVVTPYNAQVQLLRRRLEHQPELEIGSVDGLQGREKEAVIVSLVRSNDRGEVGFLAEMRRLNVAMTRARRHLTVIGDSATLASHRDLLQLVEHLQTHGSYRSAFELS
ncbi:MAG: IGHMBP2 family helicase [Planctomycetes bacterium]|nr:IGHMBP2 family helicase [Planctomycetota bacterium]